MTYDILIIGAGTAGCALAGRLSEAGKHVLLIEAGHDLPPGQEPATVLDRYPTSYGDPRYFWPNLIAEVGATPKTGGAPFARRYEQACIMGGGSSINGMVALRGLPRDYDEWRDLGLNGWGWDDVLPFFRRMEQDLDFDGPLHGRDGPIPIRRCPAETWPPLSRLAAEVFYARGYGFVDDLNGEFQDGMGRVPMSSTRKHRVSSAQAYLGPAARRRSNLRILVDAAVERITWDDARATGAIVRTKTGLETFAAGEVVVSAGSLHSPAVLMRSGVGPAGALRALGVDVVHDHPGVGQNLQNHPAIQIAAHLPRRTAQPVALREWGQNLLRYSTGVEGCVGGDMNLAIVNKSSWHPLGRRVAGIGAYLTKAYSRGDVSLQSADPAVEPMVRFRLLSDERDLKRMVEGLRLCCSLLTEPAIVAARNEVLLPDAALVRRLNRPCLKSWIESLMISTALNAPAPIRRRLLAHVAVDPAALAADDESLEQIVLQRAGPTGHPVGTCRMGPVGTEARCSTSVAACAASPACGWSTARSCRPSSAATPIFRSV
jgi:5-(hydroxymethyl)furfural/furfural oxidase